MSRRNLYSFLIGATHSGAGKTTITLGLLAALRRRGLSVQPFKCGPDYIDPGYHCQACGVPSRNLDTWMMGPRGVRASYRQAVQAADAAVIEGVMGLFDGADADRLEGSSAHVASLLSVPVVLVVDARAMARSIAALVHGFASFEKDVRIVGVIANNVGSEKHAGILRDALTAARLPPLLGWMPRKAEWEIPERHLGLMSDTENRKATAWFDALAKVVEAQIDVGRLLKLTKRPRPAAGIQKQLPKAHVRLGIARDDAFHFYYEDNLDQLREAGIEMVPFSPLKDRRIPPGVQGLYFGGGFPEMFATRLEANAAMRESVKRFADADGKIYAECGGLMYLCRTLQDREGKSHAMCGVLPAATRMEKRLQRLGYVEGVSLAAGPLGPAGTRVRGHEFHWSSVRRLGRKAASAWSVSYRRGGGADRAGFVIANVWASYFHVHFSSNLGVGTRFAAWLADATLPVKF